MNLFAPPRRFDPTYPELIDRPGTDPALVREELQMLESTNLRFGVHQLVARSLDQLLDSSRLPSLTILDLATGAADIPRAVAAWFRARQQPVTITAVDCNPAVLHIARQSCRDWPEIRLEQHNLLSLPYPAGSYDLVICSLALHHFGKADAIKVLQRVQELARVGYVVSDLRRNWLAILVTELVSRTMVKSPIARHDAPQSCRAAFTVEELRTMAKQAGMSHFRIDRHQAVFRMVLEGQK